MTRPHHLLCFQRFADTLEVDFGLHTTASRGVYVAKDLSDMQATASEEAPHRHSSVSLRQIHLEGIEVTNFAFVLVFEHSPDSALGSC